MAKPKAVIWQVYMLRKKAVWIGRVEAKDEAEARRKAIEELKIPERDRFKISVQRA